MQSQKGIVPVLYQYDSVAQLVEQMTLNHWVVGSSPTGVTLNKSQLFVNQIIEIFFYFIYSTINHIMGQRISYEKSLLLPALMNFPVHRHTYKGCILRQASGSVNKLFHPHCQKQIAAMR